MLTILWLGNVVGTDVLDLKDAEACCGTKNCSGERDDKNRAGSRSPSTRSGYCRRRISASDHAIFAMRVGR